MIAKLIAALNYAKEQEGIWRSERILKEQALIKALDTDTRVEGSKSYDVDHTKVTINKKLSYSLDFEAYKAMHFLPDNQFIRMKPTIDLKKLREVEKDFPKEVAECITTKFGKTAVTIKEII